MRQRKWLIFRVLFVSGDNGWSRQLSREEAMFGPRKRFLHFW